jgi:hypothetical protein
VCVCVCVCVCACVCAHIFHWNAQLISNQFQAGDVVEMRKDRNIILVRRLDESVLVVLAFV